MASIFPLNSAITPERTAKFVVLWPLLIIIAVFSSHCSACMPGYENERSRLRQYLGVEWLPGGLEKMDVQQQHNVRHPTDLNCDFSKPELCKWRNVRGGGLDTLDFFLFRKEDNVEFPKPFYVVQVRPGPSKVAVGDQLVLTGDKKRDEQVALLVSNQIKCQNTTGKLTFTFWLYNGARIEVLILEDREDEGLHTLPEKPQIDCGTVQMNTECTVSIPPNLQPFHLGLRAYDIKNTEGSFVMLDNINYEAQFCKIAIDFGLMTSEHLLTGARGEFVNDMSELNCDQFAATCRWRQSGTGGAIWKRATGAPPPAVMLLNETGTNIEPLLPSAFLYVEEGSGLISQNNLLNVDTPPKEFRMFISDPINCIGPSSIDLKFRIWATKGIKLSVCLIEVDSLNMHICQSIIPSLSPAKIQHNLQSTVLNFAIAFRVESVNIDFDNFVIIDDIEVGGGDQCGDLAAKLENKLLDQFLPVPMLSSLLSRPIHSAQELSCDFSKRAIGCKWANPDGLAGDVNAWEIGVRKKQKDAANTLFDGDVALARLHKNVPAYLVSETIQCILQSDGTLRLKSWNNGNGRLSVCIVRANSMEILDCQNVEIEDGKTEEEVLVDIPATDEPVKLLLRAESTGKSNDGHEGQVAVDSIQFDAKICPSIASASFAVHGVQNTPLGSSPPAIPNLLPSDNSPHPVPDENVCRLLSCDFNNGESMCLYSSTRISSSLSLFRAFNRSAFTMLFERNRVAMIESSQFHLNAPARLHFDFSIKKGSANLHVCQDSVIRELDTCLTIFEAGETVGLQHDFIELSENDRKVYIIARLSNGARKASVQIDNLFLTDIGNHKAC